MTITELWDEICEVGNNSSISREKKSLSCFVHWNCTWGWDTERDMIIDAILCYCSFQCKDDVNGSFTRRRFKAYTQFKCSRFTFGTFITFTFCDLLWFLAHYTIYSMLNSLRHFVVIAMNHRTMGSFDEW